MAKIDSREISDLRPDVRANALLFVQLMADKGFPVGISSTYRNDEQQAWLYAQGRTRDLDKPKITGSAVTTFHGARLAFDIFQNTTVKEKQYKDPLFWAAADKILAVMGFSRLSNELCHVQWSANGNKTGAQVRSGDVPRLMPLYKATDETETYKYTIQAHCKFSAPDEIWKLLDAHKYKTALYKQWADSYK